MPSGETIVARATAPGRAGIGVVRISGPFVPTIAAQLCGALPTPRYATYCSFKAADGDLIDQGLALFFPGPHSFTGEDVLELQGHGGLIVLDQLIERVVALGARLARPGEFSERAFLNDKMDLVQAEAIADLIDASSTQAARSALRSLQGEFSKNIQQLSEQLMQLRMYVEAAIDFPEEEVDFLSDGVVATRLQKLSVQLTQIKASAKQGTLLREGMQVVIVGQPNVGKSTLLNGLSGRDRAIVSATAGTTRDVLREHIQLDGLPLHIIDTAGLRESDDPIEQQGILRAWREIEQADQILLIVDDHKTIAGELCRLQQQWISRSVSHKNLEIPITVICNKIDLREQSPHCEQQGQHTVIYLSAKTGEGLSLLTEHLKERVGFTANTEGQFIARRRHLIALKQTEVALAAAHIQLHEHAAGELLAEDLRQAQHALGEITG